MSPVADAIARFALAIDDRDWRAVATCLADTVRRDYSSLTGAAPDEIAGADLVAQWRTGLTGLDAHQHLLGPPVIEGSTGDGRGADPDTAEAVARAAAHVVATHTLAGDAGSPWVVGGTYRFELRRTDDGWRITAITLDKRWETGDRALLERAATQHEVHRPR